MGANFGHIVGESKDILTHNIPTNPTEKYRTVVINILRSYSKKGDKLVEEIKSCLQI